MSPWGNASSCPPLHFTDHGSMPHSLPVSCLENCASKSSVTWDMGWEAAAKAWVARFQEINRFIHSTRIFWSPQSQLYVGQEVLDNGTTMVCCHSEVEVVFVS